MRRRKGKREGRERREGRRGDEETKRRMHKNTISKVASITYICIGT